MKITVLNATSLQRVLHSGRTNPCIFFCEDENGEKSGEYVVKLKTTAMQAFNARNMGKENHNQIIFRTV